MNRIDIEDILSTLFTPFRSKLLLGLVRLYFCLNEREFSPIMLCLTSGIDREKCREYYRYVKHFVELSEKLGLISFKRKVGNVKIYVINENEKSMKILRLAKELFEGFGVKVC